MESIDVMSYGAVFSVETDHKHNLEFVLAKAEERNQNGYGYYVGKLWDMFNTEFEKTKHTSVDEVGVYGAVTFYIVAEKQAQLERALVRCDRVVKRWINKYHINEMKES